MIMMKCDLCGKEEECKNNKHFTIDLNEWQLYREGWDNKGSKIICHKCIKKLGFKIKK